MDKRWFKYSARGSWHIYAFQDRGGASVALCGRRQRYPLSEVYPVQVGYPANERTCESCLRKAN